MTGHRAPSVADENESSVGATVESPQRDREEENAEQEQAPEIPIEEQRAEFGLLCAALTSEGQCIEPAVIQCQICQLVAYCTEECMRKDAEHHSRECPPPTEPPSRSEPTSEIPDDPVQDRGVFWANYAATDVLNLAANEGVEYNGLLRILLTGTFGLRHLIYSVVAMPETASPMLDVTISETELPHLYRTFFSLLILRKGGQINMDPYEVADLVTHVWYSYKWPSHVMDFIKNHLAVDFQPFTGGRETFVSFSPGIYPCCRYSYHSNAMTLSIGFSWSYWRAITTYLKESIDQEPIYRDREKDVKAYGEPLDYAFARMSPSRVAGLVKWRQTGLMLAYGDSPLPHVHLNPMFFCNEPKHGRPNGFTHEPLSEWPMNEILDYTPYAAEADVYGKMVAYVREMLVKFQLRLKKNPILIRLACAGTVRMMRHFTKCFRDGQKFDRIEAGHLFDINSPLCFLSFSPLLRHRDENPFATLLIMTRESFTKSETPRVEELKAAEKNKLFQPVSQSLDSIAPPVLTTDNKYSATCVHRHFALQVFDREWDMFSDRYLADASIFNFKILEGQDLKRSIFQTGWLGLEFKRKNTVKPRWQNRLMPKTGKILTEDDAKNLRRWMSWSTTKPERWLEWKKVDDTFWLLWSSYCAVVPVPRWRDHTIRELEAMYEFLERENTFLDVEREYEKCDCGSGQQRNTCEHEHKQEPALSEEQEPAIPGKEEADDDSWMRMDSAEDSAAGGATEKSKQKKKKKKKKQKKRAGKK